MGHHRPVPAAGRQPGLQQHVGGVVGDRGDPVLVLRPDALGLAAVGAALAAVPRLLHPISARHL